MYCVLFKSVTGIKLSSEAAAFKVGTFMWKLAVGGSCFCGSLNDFVTASASGWWYAEWAKEELSVAELPV